MNIEIVYTVYVEIWSTKLTSVNEMFKLLIDARKKAKWW